ncbi:hypothetical protein TNCV_5081761 [Trichonephila clavipes]|nr:hypothetical protein TNCV_5081761 [Trichonephila clavipes]
MKREIVSSYNTGGVNITDETCSIYDVPRLCNCWSFCEYFINTTGINASNVYHSVLPEKKMRRSRLLDEIRNDCVQLQWDMRSELPNLYKTLQRSFTNTEDIKKSTNPQKTGR